MWNGSRHNVAFSQAASAHVADPLGGVGADQLDTTGPLRAEEIEELLQGGPVVTGRRPHQPTRVVIDDDHQVLVATPIGDLVDPDPHQPVERIPHRSGIDHDPAGDRPHGAPGDPHQLDHRRLRAVGDQPGDLIIERSGVPGAVTGPRHRRHRHPMVGAVDPWRVGLDEHPHRAGIQRPPPPSSLTPVIAGAAPTALAATTGDTPAEPARHHDLAGVLVELDGLDDDAAFDADHPRPYPLRLHPVAPRSTSSRRQPESQAGQRGAPADAQLLTQFGASGGGWGRHASRRERRRGGRHERRSARGRVVPDDC